MATKKQTAARRKRSQARLDAILAKIGDDPQALAQLLAAIGAAMPSGTRAHRHQLVVDKSIAG